MKKSVFCHTKIPWILPPLSVMDAGAVLSVCLSVRVSLLVLLLRRQLLRTRTVINKQPTALEEGSMEIHK